MKQIETAKTCAALSRLFVLILIVVVKTSLASTFTWTRISAGNASGSWIDQANWTGGVLPTTTNDTADFRLLDLTADSTVLLNGNQNIGGLFFADTSTSTAGSWIISAGTPAESSLTLGGATPAISVNSNAAVINAVIAGSNGLMKTGTGFLQLNAANTFSGGLTLSGSDCRFSAGNSNACGSGVVVVGASPGAGQVWLNAAGGQTLNNNFEIRCVRWIIDATTVNGVAAGDLRVNGTVLLNNGSSNVRDIFPNGKNLTINGNVFVASTNNPLNKNGSATLTLNGSNFVQAASAVNAGSLLVNGPMNGGATFTVNNGALLGGTGVFSGNITVANGGKLQAGASGCGTLTCASLIANSTSQFFLALGATNNPTNGLFRVNGSLTLGGTLNLTDLGGLGVGVYTNFYYAGSLVNNGLSVVGAPVGSSVAVDVSTTPHYVLLRILAGRLSPTANQGVPMDSVSPLTLSWIELVGASSYDIYLGTVSNTVSSADTNTMGIYCGRTNQLTFNVANLQPNTTYFWRVDGVAANGVITPGTVMSFTTGSQMLDLMQDTWVAADALNRILPGYAECGSPRADRPIGIFYFLWHGTNSLGVDGPRDNTKEIQRLGGYTDLHNPWADNPLWLSGANGRSWYWGEPENGYYANDDEWVIRRHIALLEAAGVDVLGFDSTNGDPASQAPRFMKIYSVIRKMRMEGIPVHIKVFHYTHGGTGGSPATVTWLYNNFYKLGLYSDLWFHWQGKPLIVGYPNGLSGTDTPVTSEVLHFFTWRTGWANVSTTLSNEWQWVDTPTRQNFGYSLRTDIPEQLPVTCGGWANGNLGRSNTNGVQPGYDNYHLTTGRTEGRGLLFGEQAVQGLKVDPQFLWITGWNEWWAGAWGAPTYCYTRLLADCVPAGARYFVDNYNAEYSRDIEPMNGGFTDNYYFQMVGLNRQRKGVRPVPVASAPKTINVNGDFSDWFDVLPEFRDYTGDTQARNWPSTFGNLSNYTNFSGRNDLALMKVARDAQNFYFFAQCASNISSYDGSNWMVLFINADQNRNTGWEGYDYAVNLAGVGASATTLFRNTSTNNDWAWTVIRNDIAYKVTGNQLMLAVPRTALSLSDDPVTFDFHWADNFQTNDISGFSLYGDSAPERRFNYRYQSAFGATNLLLADNFDSGKQTFWSETWTNRSKWNVTAEGSYVGSSAFATSANGTDQSMLVTRLDTSKLDSFRISFRFKLANVLSAQNFQLEVFANGSWTPVRNLARDQYYSAGQSWGYDERQNVWLLCVENRSRTNAAALFNTNFAVRINASGLTNASQIAYVDDFQITGVSLPNSAPLLSPITNRTLMGGQILTITNSATDSDMPPQTLSYSLPISPPAAALNSTNGLLTWRPPISEKSNTNMFSVVVTDSGRPALSSTQSFFVTVLRPANPLLTLLSTTSGVVNLQVNGDAGPDYILQATTNLAPPVNWQPLLTNYGPLLPFWFTNIITNSLNQFYRVRLSP